MSAVHNVQFVVPEFTGKTTTNTTEGSSTEVVPYGATQVVIEFWGPGGGGARNTTTPGGGGGGAYCKKTIALLAVDWLKTISYVVGTHGLGATTGATPGAAGTASSNTTITLGGSSITLTANSGGGGPITSPGSGGTASGGDTNTTGGNGVGSTGGTGANGGAGGNPPTAPGGGGNGNSGGNGINGARGQAKFAWT